MRFMMLVKTDAKTEAGPAPDEQLLSEMGDYNKALIDAGRLIGAEGLQPSAKGARVHYSGGESKVVDGPFAEAKEIVGGFWLIDVKSREEAIAWAKRVPFQDGEVELRPLFELSDFAVDPAEQPDGWRDQEARARELPAPPRQPGTRRYMTLLKADAKTEAAAPPSEKLMTEMGALMMEMTEAGVLLSGEGLKPSSASARVAYSGKERRVIDGPFAETKELVAGYAIIQATSKEEAVDFARRMLEIHVDNTGVPEGTVDVLLVSELEDFPVDPAERPDGWRQQEQAFRDRQGG